MPRYEVTYEDVAFRGKDNDDHVGLPADVISDMDAGFRSTGAFPAGFLEFLAVTSSVDDSVYKDGRGPDGDVKLFVGARFLVEAEDMDAAEDLPVPETLLAEIADGMGIGVEFEGNWEFSDLDEASSAPSP